MREVTDERLIELQQPSDNASVIYSVMHLASCLGYSETEQALVSTAASELSTNIIKYAGSGKVYVRILSNGEKNGIEIEAVDNGPGIPDVEMAMSDSYSSGNSLGFGLQSVRRIMDEFEIKTGESEGTVVLARKWGFKS